MQLLERCRVEEIRLPAMEDDTGMKALVYRKPENMLPDCDR
jgi:hypothetical protein